MELSFKQIDFFAEIVNILKEMAHMKKIFPRYLYFSAKMCYHEYSVPGRAGFSGNRSAGQNRKEYDSHVPSFRIPRFAGRGGL